MKHDHDHMNMTRDPAMQECIQACQDCHSECLRHATQHCLEVGGAHVEPKHFGLMLSCTEICQTSANMMLMGAAHHREVCGVCASICDACAASCEKLDDMESCVQACRRCAESCRKMAA